MRTCCISHEFVFITNQVIEIINPISPIRLYIMACIPAVLASIREYHQPISKKDIMPTPSHPINNWNRLLAEISIIMAIKNNSKYLKNKLIIGSECIYQMANSRIAHVTNKATGKNIIEY